MLYSLMIFFDPAFLEAKFADIHQGDSVVVIGAGQIGSCAPKCAKLFDNYDCTKYWSISTQYCKNKLLTDYTLDQSKDLTKLFQSLTEGHGADDFIECTERNNTFEMDENLSVKMEYIW